MMGNDAKMQPLRATSDSTTMKKIDPPEMRPADRFTQDTCTGSNNQVYLTQSPRTNIIAEMGKTAFDDVC